MHQSSGTGSGSSLRVCRIHVETWAVASFVGLLTGCLESVGVFNELQSSVKFVPSDAGIQENSSARPDPTAPKLAPGESASKLFSDEYWTAVAGLDLAASHKAARGEQEIGFAQALAQFSAGDYENAEFAFAAMSRQVSDLTVAVASQTMLAATLMYGHKWAALRDLSIDSQLGLSDRQNVSGLGRWGHAFASLDVQVTTLPQTPVLLPLRITQVGTPTIHVRINGKEYEFWLDTGSSMTVVSSDVAEDARVSVLTSDTLNVGTIAGVAPVRPAILNRLEIGPIVITKTPAMVMDESLMRVRASAEGIPWGGLAVDGIIGWDTIRQFDISLDYEKGTITLQRPESLGTMGTTSQNLTWMGKPLVEVRTSRGGMLHFTLDTGAQTSFVNASIVKRVGVGTRNFDARVFGIAKTGLQAARVVPALRVDVGGKSLLMKDLIVYAPSSSGLITCDGILGSDIAHFGTIRIDASNGLFSIGE